METVNPNSPAYQLASAVKALEDVELEKAVAAEDFKSRIANLRSEIRRLATDILTGQGQLPLEGDRKSPAPGVQ